MCFVLGSGLDSLLNHRELIPVLAIVIGCGTGVIAIVFTTMAGVAKARAREATKREIAAYVAEGTIDPETAIAILNAGGDSIEIRKDGVRIT